MAVEDQVHEQVTEETDQQEADQQEIDDFESGFAGSDEPADETDEDETDDSGDDDEAGGESAQGDEPPEQDEQTTSDDEAAAGEDPEKQNDPLEEIKKLSARLRNVEGNIGGLKTAVGRMSNQDQQQASKSATETARAAGADAPSQQQVAKAFKSGEKFERLADEFPEWADAMKEVLQLNGGGNPDGAGSLDETNQKMSKENEMLRNQIVETRHRGWEKKVQTPDFGSWFDKQSEEIKALGESNNPADVIDVLDLYENDLKQPKGKTSGKQTTSNRRLESALSPTRGRAASASSAPSEEDEFQSGFKSRN